MTEEFNLSEKIEEFEDTERFYIEDIDIKEAVRRLKAGISLELEEVKHKHIDYLKELIFDRIDKIFGEKLI